MRDLEYVTACAFATVEMFSFTFCYFLIRPRMWFVPSCAWAMGPSHIVVGGHHQVQRQRQRCRQKIREILESTLYAQSDVRFIDDDKCPQGGQEIWESMAHRLVETHRSSDDEKHATATAEKFWNGRLTVYRAYTTKCLDDSGAEKSQKVYTCTLVRVVGAHHQSYR